MEKIFKEVKEGDCIYGVYDNGVVTYKWVKEKFEDWYEHMCHFHFDNGSIKVNMFRNVYIDDMDKSLLYFADKDNAIEHINYILNKAKEEIEFCKESLELLCK